VKQATSRALIHILVAAGAFAGAAYAAEGSEAVPVEISAPPCLERAAAVAYLHRFQDQIMQRWAIPEDTLADQTVSVRFRFAEDGNLADWKLHFWSNRRVADSVERAFRHATSAGPIPEPAACLIGRMVEMHFENPY
jgi:hypothetical protein